MSGWQNATSVAEATKNYCGWYERPAEQYFYSSMSKRTKAAQDYYNKYSGKDLSSFESSGGNGNILQSAEKIHTYMEKNKYYYSLSGSVLKNTFEESKKTKGVCCATFVSWVLRDAGLINQTNHSASGLANMLEQKYHWKKVKGTDLKAGDVMYYSYGHIELYAGNKKIYNAGSITAIQGAAPSNQYATPTYGLRAP